MGSTALDISQQQDTATPIDDSLLVKRAQAGDMDAFETLYNQHIGRVYALCLRMCREGGRAEELAQEAFVRAWEKLGSFRGESQFSTWLHRLTVNVIFGAMRKQGRRSERETAYEDMSHLEHPTREAHPGTVVDLEAAMATLPDGARNAFILHDVEGYKHHEIAAMTGIATGTSKAHVHRARKLLREVLA